MSMAKPANIKNCVLKALAASVASAALLANVPAQALEYEIGGVQIFFDTTVSAGVQLRTQKPKRSFLAQPSSGRANTQPDLRSGAAFSAAVFATGGGVGAADTNGSGVWDAGDAGFDPRIVAPNPGGPFNNFGSLNNDDGNLNYRKNDVTSASLKVRHEVEAIWENWRAFGSVLYFADAVQNSKSHTRRSDFDKNLRERVGRDIQLLDAYVTGDFDLGGHAAQIKVGNHVLNWGESTFNLNGINVINPIDVTNFRRPGSEIKEALLPQLMVSGSFDLTDNLSIEAFYQLDYQDFKLDPQATFFSTSDVVGLNNSSVGGNVNGVAFLGQSNLSGGYRRNCANPLLPLGPVTIGAPLGTISYNQATECGIAGTPLDFNTPLANEATRLAFGDQNVLPQLGHIQADDNGQFGVALRYFAEELNSTEFGLYFVNYHSRRPIVSIATGAPRVFDTPVAQLVANSTLAAKAFIYGGCGLAAGLSDAGGSPIQGLADPISAIDPTLAFTPIADPSNILGTLTGPRGTGSLTPVIVGGAVVGVSTSGAPSNYLVPGLGSTYGGLVRARCDQYQVATFAPFADATGTLINQFAPRNTGVIDAGSGVPGTGAALFAANGVTGDTVTAQPGFSIAGLGDPTQVGIGILNGVEVPALAFDMGTLIEYPENIKMVGASFNTTIAGWGVQGEVAAKFDQPLQISLDELVLTGLGNNCVYQANFGLVGPTLDARNQNNAGGGLACGAGTVNTDQRIKGFTRETVLSATIGTTSLYTPSNPVIEMLGADQGILVTEVSAIYIPDMPGKSELALQQNNQNSVASANAAFLGADPTTPGVADYSNHPDKFSWGYVLLGRLTYNNAIGPVSLTPQIAFRHDVQGLTPGPLTRFIEDRKRLGLSLTADYQDRIRANVSYTTDWGGGIQNIAQDRDFISFSLSYSF